MRQVVDGLTDDQLAGRPRRSPSPATRSPGTSWSPTWSAASSTRSGTTTSTRPVTSPSSSSGPPDPCNLGALWGAQVAGATTRKVRNRNGSGPFVGMPAGAAYGLAHRRHSTPRRALRPSSSVQQRGRAACRRTCRTTPGSAGSRPATPRGRPRGPARPARRGHVQAVDVERLRRRHVADRGLDGGGRALDALDDPLEDAAVLAEARPQEAAVVVAAEPVDVEDLRQLGRRRASLPMSIQWLK